MNPDNKRKFCRSVRRITVTLAVLLGIPAVAYWLWRPGSSTPLPEYSDNAVWVGHGWLGNDDWFARNRRGKSQFRDEAKIAALFQKLRENHISIVYPHLCPAQFNGAIAPCDEEQLKRFLNLAAAHKIRVIPWIGGVFEDSARPAEARWRRNFVASVEKLLKDHPRLAGVQVNVEPMPSGKRDFLKLLEELRSVTKGKILSVAAYPPPTRWQPGMDVHWSMDYAGEVARRCDQFAVMMYDTSIPLEKCYTALMVRWTKELAAVVPSCNSDLLLGVPAYTDDGVGYHHVRVEHLSSALQGISAAAPGKRISGIALYCEWEMNASKWQEWRKFIR